MTPKGGLGRGLEALIPMGNTTQTVSTTSPSSVPLESISPNPHQPRSRMNDEELRELADSIREHGVIQPLIVTRTDEEGKYILIAGERRLRASRLAGLDTVPVVIRDQATDLQQLELALIENVQRSDLTPLETAEAYRQLQDDFSLSHEDIAARVGKSRVSVTNTLRLLKLPAPVQQALAELKITEGHARALLGLNSPHAQIAALQTLLHNDLSVRKTEELVRKLSGEKVPSMHKPDPSPETRSLEDRLRARLGTKVALNRGQKGGTVVIRYYSEEELDSLVRILLDE